MTHRYAANKACVAAYRAALYDVDPHALHDAINDAFATNCVFHLAFPFEDRVGVTAFIDTVITPLLTAMPDLERRDYIVIANSAGDDDWVGCAGYYTGVFDAPFLGIPPTGHQVTLRFHEFYRIEDGSIVEMQALWDIPELMMQARAWPMAPSLGVEIHVPGPATQDGLVTPEFDESHSTRSKELVATMLQGLTRHATGGVEAMQLGKYWHPKMNWYGPAGIGTNRGIDGFRYWHQIPFLNAMPDRQGSGGKGVLFAEGDYVGFTAWPGMTATISNTGWMGIAPANQAITMRSLDFWRCENGLIRENWVLVDLLHVYDQIGVDVFARMREMTYRHHRNPPIAIATRSR